MRTIRSLITMSLVISLTEAVLFTDRVRIGWMLAHTDGDLRP